ncbi:DUF3024 domain-containing protein [Algoriphagus yeomjeoni]|uniref:DUF3024 family protein n=1 Tax=Algoriphagus yeomjeoni TaxID=291403 RepID=A0A327P346_9BACT|nr:DUF3024 domain-containing protein [Algoriphagus yeomjeoni]RAI84366.1 Protein of unknown function (DUF3024) [Algoriphagus yeomjeoni]
MAFSKEHLRDIESSLTIWLALRRPDEEIRNKLDLGYTIKGQDIFLEEVRPIWNKPSESMRNPFAKIKYEKSTDLWKIYWMRGNLKWAAYEPKAEVVKLELALEEIVNDPIIVFLGRCIKPVLFLSGSLL